MKEKIDRNYNDILKESMDLNQLSYKDIVFICERSEHTVFKWINGTLVPDKMAIAQLFLALNTARKKIPYSLARAKDAAFQRSKKWALINKTESAKSEFIGEKIWDKKDDALFKYNGDLLSISQIAKLTGLKHNTVYTRTRTKEYETDVTKIVDRPLNSRACSEKREANND